MSLGLQMKSEYDFLGNTVNASLITQLNNPWGLTAAGSTLLVTNFFGNSVGAYTSTGGIINATFITGLNLPTGIAVTNAPEPATLAALATGGFCLLGRRGRRRQK